jgi:hypothetical protein
MHISHAGEVGWLVHKEVAPLTMGRIAPKPAVTKGTSKRKVSASGY